MKQLLKPLLNIPGMRRAREFIRNNYELKLRAKHYRPATHYGLAEQARSPRVIVSLTSFPARIGQVHHTLNSLLRQSCKPDLLILWLAEEQFPGKEKDLPDSLLHLIQFGLEIKWCSDWRSHKKLIPALSEFSDDIIVTADDDTYYPPHWLHSFYMAHLEAPWMIRAGMTHHMTLDATGGVNSWNQWEQHATGAPASYRNHPVGHYGTLYPPHCLHEDIFREDLFMSLAPRADDLWFWAMAVLKGTKIWPVQKNRQQIISFPAANQSNLYQENVHGGGNDHQLQQILERYPLILERLRQDES